MLIYELITLMLITFISNATPFFGAPYTILASILLIKQGFTPLNFIIISVTTGLAAAAAKLVMYGVGYSLRHPLKRNKNIQLLQKFIETKYFPIALFVLAILPGLPFDDYLFIGGGIARASALRMEQITGIAKVIKSFIEIYIESKGILIVSDIINISPTILGVVSFIIFLVLGIVLLKIDWEKYIILVRKYLEKK